MESEPRKLEIDLSWMSFFRFAVFAAIIASIIELSGLLMLLFLGLLLAVAIEPCVVWLEKKMPRPLALSLVILVTLIIGFSLFFGVAPPLLEQTRLIIKKSPELLGTLKGQLANMGLDSTVVERLAKMPAPDPQVWAQRLVSIGRLAFGVISSVVLTFAFMIYFLVDGRQTYQWALAFFNAENRAKLESTALQTRQVVVSYIFGQAMTSLLCGIFVYALLSFMHVPGPLFMGVIAAIFDILPLIGFILTAVPAIVFALSVSSSTGLAVALGFAIYHIVENYMIVPWIYGSSLRLTGLAVLVSCMVGAALGGILGAILLLPVIASYTIVEKIWLKNYLGSRVIAKHEALDASVTGTK